MMDTPIAIDRGDLRMRIILHDEDFDFLRAGMLKSVHHASPRLLFRQMSTG
jgi:hypothetical protein